MCLLAGPDVCAFNGDQGVELVSDDFVCHDVVEDCADGGTGHLHGEGYARGEMVVLSELEILGENLTLD